MVTCRATARQLVRFSNDLRHPYNIYAAGTIMREVGEYWRLGVIILASKFCLIDDDFDPTVPFNEKGQYKLRSCCPRSELNDS